MQPTAPGAAPCGWLAALMRTWRGKGLEEMSSLCLECLHHTCAQMIPHAPREVFLRILGLLTSNICDSVNICETPSQSNLGRGRGIRHAGVASHRRNSEHANIVHTHPITYFLRVLHSRRVHTLYIIIKSPRDKRVCQARMLYQTAPGMCVLFSDQLPQGRSCPSSHPCF